MFLKGVKLLNVVFGLMTHDMGSAMFAAFIFLRRELLLVVLDLDSAFIQCLELFLFSPFRICLKDVDTKKEFSGCHDCKKEKTGLLGFSLCSCKNSFLK